MSSDEESSFLKAISEEASAIRLYKNFLSQIDVENSKAERLADKEAIFDTVRQNTGFQELNRIVFEQLNDWIVATLQKSVNETQDESERSKIELALGSILTSHGKFTEAEILLKSSLNNRIAVYTINHVYTLQSMNNLALLYRKQGKYDEAELLFLDCLKGCIENPSLGPTHADTLAVLTNLSDIYFLQGNHDDAEINYSKAYEGFLSTLTIDHPNTLSTLNKLASAYQQNGKLSEALDAYIQCYDCQCSTMGKDHMDTLTTLTNLALVYSSMGDYNKSKEAHSQVLSSRTAKLGNDHPSTLISMNNLASVYQSLKKYDEAENKFKLCLIGREQTLGLENPETLQTLANLARLYEEQKKYDDAELLYKTLLDRTKSKLGGGNDSMDVYNIFDNLASLYDTWGKYSECEKYYTLMIDFKLRTGLKESDIEIVGLRSKLAIVYENQGKFEQAKLLYERNIKFENEFYPNHNSNSNGNHSNSNGNPSNSNSNNSQQSHQVTNSISNKLTNNPIVLLNTTNIENNHNSKNNTYVQSINLANIYKKEGNIIAAEKLYMDCLESLKTEMGSEHIYTLSIANELASLYVEQKFFDKACIVYEQALAFLYDGVTTNMTTNTTQQLAQEKQILIANMQNSLGFALIQLGKYNDAEKHLLVASTAFRDIYNTNSNNTTTTNIIDKQFLVSSSSLSSLVEKTKTIELLSLFSTLSNLASLYVKMEQYEKAKSLAEECLTWFTANLGKTHRTTISEMHTLSQIYKKLGMNDEVEVLLLQLVEISKESYGDDNIQTLITIFNLAQYYARLKKFNNAENYYKECYEKAKKSLGSNDSNTVLFKNTLIKFYKSQNNNFKADLLDKSSSSS